MHLRIQWRVLAFQLLLVTACCGSCGLSAAASPFAGLLKQVDLFAPGPQQQPPAEIALGKLDEHAFIASQMTLLTDFVAISGRYTFVLADKPNAAIREFPIMVAPMKVPSNEPDYLELPGNLRTKPVASLLLKTGTLYLVWNPQNKTTHAGQLANAQLQLELNGHHHTINLRTLRRGDPILLDLTNPVQRIPLQLDNLPARGKLRVTLNAVDNVSSGPEFDFDKKPLELEQSLTLVRRGEIKSEIDLQLVKSSTGPELRAKAFYFDESARRQPLVGTKVKKKMGGLERSYVRNKKKLAAAETALPRIAAEIRTLSNRRPANDSEAVRKAVLLRNLNQQYKKANNAIIRCKRSLPQIKTAIEHLKEVNTLGQQLHENITFHFSVDVFNGNHAMLLAIIGQQPH